MRLAIFSTVAAACLLAPNAHALINLELDQNSMTVVAPSSGTLDVEFTGTIILTDGWTNDTSTVWFPSTVGFADTLNVNFSTAYLTWEAGPQTTNYSGALFDVTVLPTSLGTYFLGGGSSGLAEFDAHGVDPTNTYSFDDTEAYEVTVTAAPEPSSMVALAGFGAAALIRRRRKA